FRWGAPRHPVGTQMLARPQFIDVGSDLSDRSGLKNQVDTITRELQFCDAISPIEITTRVVRPGRLPPSTAEESRVLSVVRLYQFANDLFAMGVQMNMVFHGCVGRETIRHQIILPSTSHIHHLAPECLADPRQADIILFSVRTRLHPSL